MLPRGRRIAIDYGDVRNGVAISDLTGLIASPLTTLNKEQLVSGLQKLVTEEEVVVVYVGLPLHLSGNKGFSSEKALEMALLLKIELGDKVAVRMIDERLSTKSAIEDAARSDRRLEKSKVDQMAAVVILESALERERSSGELAGNEI